MADREFTNINGIKVCDQTARDSIPTKTSQLSNDSDFATNASVDEKISGISTGETVDLSGYAKKTDIPTRTSQLANDSNFAVKPNFTYAINMISADQQATVTTTGTYPNLTITFNIPQGTGGGTVEEPTKYMYYGRLSIAEVGGSVIQYNQITASMIKAGAAVTRNEPTTLGKTSLGLASTTAEGDYVIIAVPDGDGYTVTQDNGIGGKAIFDEDVAGANGQYKLDIDGVTYALYGQILLSQSEKFIYVDKN